MPRAAGNSAFYTFVLKDKATDKYRTSIKIELPSVTKIIGATLAKPMLVWWAHNQTVDTISGLAQLSIDGQLDFDLLEVLADPDDAKEFFKNNKLRPDDVKEEASDRGTEAHAFLEELGNLFLKGGEMVAQKAAAKVLSSDGANPYHKAVAGWWQDTNPVVEASETVLYSLKHGYAGTCDLIWWDNDGLLVCTDLKSRKSGAKMYESDDIQTGAYALAWDEMNDKYIDRRTVLLAHDDGTFQESEATLDQQVFLDLLSVYKGMRP